MNLLFVGDVMLGRLVNQRLKKVPPEYPWGNTIHLFQDADFRLCNLECVISDSGSPWSATPKAFHYRTDAKNVEVLRRAKINGVSLANNHILDYEEDALLDCVRILDENGILHAGAGKNLADAERPFITEIDGIKIGFLSFTDNEPDWEAEENKPGIFYVPIDLGDLRSHHLMDRIRRLKCDVDICIVSAHWGPNWGYPAFKEHIEFSHALIDAGVDIIFGHSPHIFRGIEIYKNRPILYSTGNFVDDYAVDQTERNDRSCIFILELDGNKLSRILLYPTIIEDFQANLATGGEAEEIMDKMQALCADLHTNASKTEGRLEIRIGGQHGKV